MRFIVLTLLLTFLCACGEKKSEENNTPSTSDSLDVEKIESEAVSSLELPNTIYFRATGTEPFWSLEISDEMILYRTPEDSIRTPHADPVKAMDANVLRYDLNTESASMKIQISMNSCTNQMSGKESPYTVEIEFKKSIDQDFQTVKGCGDYIIDYRLHDIWVLQSMNSKKVSLEDFTNELPSMEINTNDNSFMGYAGCNRMNGNIFFEKGLLRFTNVATTKKLCPPNNLENDFLKTLRSVTSYKFTSNGLELSNPNGELLSFKKVD